MHYHVISGPGSHLPDRGKAHDNIGAAVESLLALVDEVCSQFHEPPNCEPEPDDLDIENPCVYFAHIPAGIKYVAVRDCAHRRCIEAELEGIL